VWNEGTHISCYSLFKDFSWLATCHLDRNKKTIRIALEDVDCTDYGIAKVLTLYSDVYSAVSENASTYNDELTITGISPPAVAAGAT
jgi:hypothetical protein